VGCAPIRGILVDTAVNWLAKKLFKRLRRILGI